MIALVRTELLKLYWTRATWGFLAAAVVLVVIRVEMVLSSLGKVDAPPSGSRQLTLDVLGASAVGALVIVLLGVVTVTREFHHATWTSTLLETPDRPRVLAAKFVTAALVGAIGAAFLLVVAAGLGLASGNVRLFIDARQVQLVAGGLMATVWWAWIGAAIGTVIRSQTVALLIPPVWILVIETLLPSYGLGAVLPWTPNGLTAALGGADFAGVLPEWAAALTLLGYGLVLSVAGVRRAVRSDVC
jgi:ABC-2 type transport system permease protein